MNDDEYSKKEKEDRSQEKSGEKYHEINRDHKRRVGLGALGAILVLIVVFMIGRATTVRFGNYRIGRGVKSVSENSDYYGGMMGGRGGRMMDGYYGGRGMMGNGAQINTRISGDITAINDNKVTVKASDGTEYTANVTADTSYRNSQGIAKQSDLKTGNSVSILGASNSNGEINASLIVIN